MCKLGDKTFKKNELEIEQDMAREENQVSKIRELVKERNRLRGEINRIHQKAPAPKRRKLEDAYETGIEQADSLERQQQEKRKAHQEQEPQPPNKRRKTTDIRNLLQPKAGNTKPNCQDATQEHPETEGEQEQVPHTAGGEKTGHYPSSPCEDGVHCGEEVTVEMVNWEEAFQQHLEETRRIERERDKNK